MLRTICLLLVLLQQQAECFVPSLHFHPLPFTSSPTSTRCRAVSPWLMKWVEPPAVEYLGTSGEHAAKPLVVFPGGGLFFWWQAGYVLYMQQHQQSLLERSIMAGASAGSLTAVLAACGVDMQEAFQRASDLCEQRNVWTKPLGLMGCWGSIVEEWLEQLLPPHAHELCSGRVYILVTTFNGLPGAPTSPLQRRRISDFRSRQDLIAACLASAHIPLFMDGRLLKTWRGAACVDGSLLAEERDLYVGGKTPDLVVDYYTLDGGKEAPPPPLPGSTDTSTSANASSSATASSAPSQEYFLQLKPGPEYVKELMRRGASVAKSRFSGPT